MAEIKGFQRLGPLTSLVGYWEGNVGTDVSFRHQHDKTITTGYFEKFWFQPIPQQHNGDQTLEGVKYGNQAWRHGEEGMDPFHDEVGYMLWDEVRGQIMRAVVFGRGISMLAGSDAKAHDKKLRFKATPGDPHYGILQNKYLTERAELMSFDNVITIESDDTFSYEQTLVLRLKELGGNMDHTDKNTLHRVKRIHASDEV